MENFKKYLPYIIAAVIGLFILSRLRGSTTKLVPQTQFVETPQTDPLATLRGQAFEALTNFAAVFVMSEAERESRQMQSAIASKALDIDLAKTQVNQQSILQALNTQYLTREQDRQMQQGAIDRYYSSRRTSDIVGSVNQALSTIFGGSRNDGSIFRTPPTFPFSF